MSIPLNFWIRPYTYNVFLINAIRAKYRKNKRLANLILLVCLPYITVNWLLSELLAVIRTPFLRRIGGVQMSSDTRWLLPVFLKMRVRI